jgi:uncharacterized protein
MNSTWNIMQDEVYLKKTEEYVYGLMSNDTTGHDWWHIYRVRKLAGRIAESEGGDSFIIQMAALLHDVDDWKIKKNGDSVCIAESWMFSLSLPAKLIERIISVIDEVSFKGNMVADRASSLEAKIVQDADRIDAIGAIGIARAFAYGGSKRRQIYNPSVSPGEFRTFEEYKTNEGTTINHFYEKLLLLKDRMNTPTGREIAECRHNYMAEFLKQFFNEWEVE